MRNSLNIIFIAAGIFFVAACAGYSQDTEEIVEEITGEQVEEIREEIVGGIVEEIVIDDFEGTIAGGSEGTVDFGSGGGTFVDVRASSETKHHGEQSLQIDFDAVPGGYMWIARGYGLDVEGAGAWIIGPEYIDFEKFNCFAFYMHGANTNTQVAIDLIDSGREYWRYLIDDDFSGWKEIAIPFSDFSPRGDWQPDTSDKNAEFKFPFMAFQFEPRGIAKGTIYFDYIRVVALR